MLALWALAQRLRARSRAAARAPSRSSSTRARRPRTACPHNGHVLTRVIKDLFPRYKTMRGYHVARKAGWDTHGLPVEVEVEKELRIHGKAAIEEYGVEPFIAKCIESVFRYTRSGSGSPSGSASGSTSTTRTSRYHNELRRERVVGARGRSSTRACSTRATRSSGGGRKAARRSPRPRSGSATRTSTTRASTCVSRCRGGDPEPATRSSCGRRRRGRSPRTRAVAEIRSSIYVGGRRAGDYRKLIVPAAALARSGGSPRSSRRIRSVVPGRLKG